MTDPRAAPTPPYHHGNLRAALVDAGVELAREGGPDAVVLREASRRVGVSHNAAYRHFKGRDELLKEVCDRCMAALADLMRELIGRVDPSDRSLEAARQRLRATGSAYVRFALAEPGMFRTAFSVPTGMTYASDELAGDADPAAGAGPFTLLGRQLDALKAAGGLPPARRPGAEFAAWSGVHGLAMLLLEGPLRELPEPERERVLGRLLDTIERGL
jgi:AcrR family transcriptional regulator